MPQKKENYYEYKGIKINKVVLWLYEISMFSILEYKFNWIILGGLKDMLMI